jgi:lambda family phage minor tail protein L
MGLERSRDKITKAVFDMEPTAVIDFYRIYPNTVTKPKSYLNVHNGSVFGGGVYWQGELYSPIPMEVEGFSINSSGKPNRPIIRISNKDLLLTNLLSNNEDFKNAKVERRRTFLKFLDDDNFDLGNPWGESDPKAEISVDIYFVSQKRQENKAFVELELTSPLDIESRNLTNRKILAKYCPWNYRGAGCDYRGVVVERDDGKPFTYGKDVRQGNKDVSNAELKNPSRRNRNIATSQDRSYIGMENFGEDFIFSNAKDLYDSQKGYQPGDVVYIVNDRVRIQDPRNPNIYRSSLTYFVCRKYAKPGVDPRDNPGFWDKDGCGKKLNQCKRRFAKPTVQTIFLETDFYEQQMWNIQNYEESVHQGYLKLQNNYSDSAERTKQLFNYNLNGWGYRQLAGESLSYNNDKAQSYENAFYLNSSDNDSCEAAPSDAWSSSTLNDSIKEFTVLVDIEYLGPPQRYELYPEAANFSGVNGVSGTQQDIESDVDQIIFKTSKEDVGYGTDHSQFVLGIQKAPYMEFSTFAPYSSGDICAKKTHRIKLAGVNEPDDYLRITDRNGLPNLPSGGYDIKNSKNFVFSLRKDYYNGKNRFRANWSCLTYPDSEEADSVFIESQSTFYIKNMITTDTDRFVFFGGTTNMPVSNASGEYFSLVDIDRFTDVPYSYDTKWSQQDLQVGSVGIWAESLTNGQLAKIKSKQNATSEGVSYAVEVVKLWDTIVEEEADRTDKILESCYHFWQEPFQQDGDFYVKDHKNGNHLLYKDSNYPFGGGSNTAPFTRDGYDLTDLQFLTPRNPNVGKETLVEGEFGTLPFGGFPGTDGYRFSS